MTAGAIGGGGPCMTTPSTTAGAALVSIEDCPYPTIGQSVTSEDTMSARPADQPKGMFIGNFGVRLGDRRNAAGAVSDNSAAPLRTIGERNRGPLRCSECRR